MTFAETCLGTHRHQAMSGLQPTGGEHPCQPFAPFPGFEPELYRNDSAPWFKEGHYVLRGDAWATRSRLAHNSYRNFFTPDRHDILAGFRSCAR